MSNRSQWHAVDWANHRSSLVRERGKPKGELIWAGIMDDKESRDEMARAHRREKRHVVTTGERVVKFDSVSITTYTITIRERLAA